MRGISISPIYPDTTATDDGLLPVVVAFTCSTALLAALAQLAGRLLG